MKFFPDLAAYKGPLFGKNWAALTWADDVSPYEQVQTAPAWPSDAPPQELVHSHPFEKTKSSESPFTRSRIFAALQALGAPNDAPAPPHAPDWMSMPQPHFSGLLDPHIGQPQTMPAPAWMQPYLWGGR